jgi:hypothetical protein
LPLQDIAQGFQALLGIFGGKQLVIDVGRGVCQVPDHSQASPERVPEVLLEEPLL